MFLSKIWFVLVALFAGFALSIALTAPRPMAQRLKSWRGSGSIARSTRPSRC